MIARPVLSAFALFFSFAGAAFAQTTFNLNSGAVSFTAPAEWPVIMQMTEGSPQVVAFQVKDPADNGTDEASRVSVTTRKLDDAQAFQAFVNSSLDKARQTPGFESEAGNEGSSLRYSGLNVKTRYKYRESYYYQNGIGIQLRCVHPILKGTSPAWVAALNQGCDLIATSLQK